jgi:hypothetical protein
MASIKLRRDGVWLLIWRAPDPRTGKVAQRSKTFAGTRGDALRAAHELEAEGRRNPQQQPSAKTFGAFMEEWLRWRADLPTVQPTTMRRDGQNVTVLRKLIGHVPLAVLSVRDLDELTAGLHRAGYAPQTVAHAFGVARKILRQAR